MTAHGVIVLISTYISLITVTPAIPAQILSEQDLNSAFLTRKPPVFQHIASPCRIFWYQSEFQLTVLNIPAMEQSTLQISSNQTSSPTSTQEFKHSLACLQIVFFVPLDHVESIVSRTWVTGILQNMRQNFVHFLFIGDKASLIDLMSSTTIHSLKYKTGLCIDCSSTSRYITRDTGQPPMVGLELPPHSGEKGMLEGRRLKIAQISLEPYILLDEFRRPLPNLGQFYNVILTSARHYNFSYELDIVVPSFDRLPNGSWQGTLQELVEGTTDIFFIFPLIYNRFPHFDFTAHLYITRLVFLTSNPQVFIKWQAIFYPFNTSVWSSLLVICLLSIPAFYLQLRLSRHGTPDPHPGYTSISLPFATLLQSSQKIPSRSKLLGTLFVFCSVIIGTAYTSNLVSYLTFPEAEHVPRTFSQLSEHSSEYKIKHFYYPGGAGVVFFNETKNPVFTKIAQQFQQEADWLRCTREALIFPRRVCITWPIINDMLMAKNLTIHSAYNPALHSYDEAISLTINAALTKHSRYLEAFQHVIGMYRDFGYIDKWFEEVTQFFMRKSRAWMRHLVETKDEVTVKLARGAEEALSRSSKPFSVNNLTVCFASLLGGLLIALIAFMVEVVVQTWVLQLDCVRVTAVVHGRRGTQDRR